MTHKRESQFTQELRKWKRNAVENQPDHDDEHIVTTRATHNIIAHIKPLHRNVALVEFPMSKGGGWSYYKNAHAVRRLEAKGGYKVTWL